MFKLKQSLIAFAGLSLVVGLVAVIIPAVMRGQGGSGNQQPLNVNVVNATAAPVPIRDVSVPVPFQHSMHRTNLPEGTMAHAFSIDVPAGKLAVIEHVSFSAALPLGQAARASLTCQGGASTGHVGFRIPFESEGAFDVEFEGTLESMSLLVANSPVRCYADGNSGIIGGVSRNSTTGRTGDISFAVSGHLLDRP